MADADGTEPAGVTDDDGPDGTEGADRADRTEQDAPTATAARRPRRPRRLPHFTRGTVIGRYVIVDPLGRGGMGDVYSAYDPELDRRIALKLVRDLSGDGRERLIAEAKAMARVSHPDVCAVHDAGSFADGVFIAMELIEGETLASWRKDQRTRAEILAVFAAAGRGMIAAHAAGIIHRDFKPGNVMIGNDGRVRVLDFGLARAVPSAGSRDGASSDSLDTVSMTPDDDDDDSVGPRVIASRAMGTPSYMAPEQRKPGVHDARVDQYAFAVAAYETLYGERPFEGENPDAVAANALAHRVRPPPRDADVPARLRRALVRALSPDPRDRYPSLDLLLAELTHDSTARRRRIALAIAIAGLAALAVIGLTRRRSAPTPCRGADQPVARAWTDAARAKIALAFRATGRPSADAWTSRVAAELDRQARELGAARIAACEATSVRHEQSATLLDLRVACLDRRLTALDALIDRLGAAPDLALMDRALDAIAALPPADACADTSALLTVAPRPRDPAAQPAVTAALTLVAEVTAARYAADVHHARERADAAVVAADATGWAPIEAEARLEQVRAAQRAGDPAAVEPAVFRAAELAAQAHADQTAAEAWIVAIGLLTDLGRPREAVVMVHAAEAALARLGPSPRLRADLLHQQSFALEGTGDFAAAAARESEALSQRQATGAEPLIVADSLNHLAILASLQGDHAGAEALHRKVLAIRTAVLGDAHPDVASSLDNLGAVVYHQGRLDDALALYEQALTRRLAALGPDHEDVGTSFNNLGGVYLDRGDLAHADESFSRALATWEKALGADHLSLAIPLGNLGDVALAREQPGRALELCKRAYQLEARASGEASPELAYSLTCEGEALIAQHAPGDARPILERALGLREGTAVDAGELARTRLALARALDAAHQDPARVKALATAAQAGFAAAGPSWTARAAQAAALLHAK